MTDLEIGINLLQRMAAHDFQHMGFEPAWACAVLDELERLHILGAWHTEQHEKYQKLWELEAKLAGMAAELASKHARIAELERNDNAWGC